VGVRVRESECTALYVTHVWLVMGKLIYKKEKRRRKKKKRQRYNPKRSIFTQTKQS
jgi:hypothetical protein